MTTLIEVNISRDFIGWAVSVADKRNHTEKVYLGFRSKDDAENKKLEIIKAFEKEVYQGSGVTGNTI